MSLEAIRSKFMDVVESRSSIGKVRCYCPRSPKLSCKLPNLSRGSMLEWVCQDTIGCVKIMYIRDRMGILSLSFSMSYECNLRRSFQIYGCRGVPIYLKSSCCNPSFPKWFTSIPNLSRGSRLEWDLPGYYRMCKNNVFRDRMGIISLSFSMS